MVESALYKRPIAIWMWFGVVLILIQIAIGGITRLTGSGLSITQWDIVTGVIPPLHTEDWIAEFAKYQDTPQYAKINAGMTLSEFKFIYFWEYIHRLWARMVGFVFLIPFIYFLMKRWLDRRLMIDLVGAFALGGVVGLFGWIMVASGLIHRPWVNAYKLSLHLGLGVLLWTYLIWVAARYSLRNPARQRISVRMNIQHHKWLIALVFVQILLGGLMSGMKASLFFPTWPDYHGAWIPAVLWDANNWTWSSLTHYDTNTFIPGIVQFLHRNMAYAITIYYSYLLIQYSDRWMQYGFVLLLLQIVLGILTLLGSIGSIPIFLGAAHQLVGILFFGYLVYLAIVRLR